MLVRKAMASTTSTANPRSTVARVAELMKMEDCGFIPVVQAGALVGILGCGELEQALHATGAAATEATPGVTRGTERGGGTEPEGVRR
jgi:predicted transcriptional regulator